MVSLLSMADTGGAAIFQNRPLFELPPLSSDKSEASHIQWPKAAIGPK